MKSFFKGVLSTVVGMILALLLALIIIPAFFILVFKGAQQKPTFTVENNSVLHLKLDGQLVERQKPLSFEIFGERSIFSDDRTIGLWELSRAIRFAKADKRISGIFIEVIDFSAGWAGATSLRRQIEDFAKSGKFVYAYADRFNEMTYYIASAATKITMQPQGDFEFNGLAVNEPFLKGLFAKLDLQPRIFRVGKFKAAVEPLILDQMSDENRKQTQEMIDDLWGTLRKSVAQTREITEEQVDEVANKLLVMSAQEAKTTGLIHETLFKNELKSVEGKFSTLKADENVKIENANLVTPGEFLRDPRAIDPVAKGKKIAVLFAEGEIRSGTSPRQGIWSEELVEDLQEIEKDENVGAVVLRINSPGGDALASDVIWQQVSVMDKKIPVIISMGDVAASGGYYIAAGGRYIFAEPTTVTGSIGVFGVMFGTEKFFREKAGVNFDRVVSHQFADFGNPNREMTPFEVERMQSEVERVYKRFIDVVEEGRGYEKREDLESIAEGRIWSGTRAKEIGLVDEIGGIEQAILKAAEYAELGTNYQVQIFPADVDPFSRILEQLSGGSFEGILSSGLEYMGIEQAKIAVQKLQILQSGVHMRLPFDLEIK